MERRIEHVRDLLNGTEIVALEFFRSEERIVFLRRYGSMAHILKDQEDLVCSVCNQPVHIAGTKDQEFFFKHYKEKGDCPIKTKGDLNQTEIDRLRYAGVKESTLHLQLKDEVEAALLADKGQCSKVRKEQVRRSSHDPRQWRKPDVSCDFLGKKIVFEIQLSTTYLNVIAEREEHYHEDQTFVLWLFANFDPEGLRFVEKDILYANHGKAFVFDDEARKRSEAEGKLVLHCFQLLNRGDSATDEWEETFVSLADLTFDTSEYRAYLTPPELRRLAGEFEDYWLNNMSANGADRWATGDEFILRFASEGICFDYEIEPVLNALYSLKTGNMIAYKYSSDANGFLQMANVFLKSHPRYIRIFFWGMKEFEWREKVMACKQGRKLKEKFDTIWPTLGNPEYKFPDKHISLIRLLFPELPPKAYGMTDV